jgi:hypothetical protein
VRAMLKKMRMVKVAPQSGMRDDGIPHHAANMLRRSLDPACLQFRRSIPCLGQQMLKLAGSYVADIARFRLSFSYRELCSAAKTALETRTDAPAETVRIVASLGKA